MLLDSEIILLHTYSSSCCTTIFLDFRLAGILGSIWRLLLISVSNKISYHHQPIALPPTILFWGTGMKKLFHRKKNDSAPSSPDQTPPRNQRPQNTNANPSFRTSRYETTTPAERPQTGQFPLKGNNSSVSVQGRRSDTYSRGQNSGGIEPDPRPSTSNPYYGALPAPRVTSASYGHGASAYPPVDGTSEYNDVNNHQGSRQHAPPTIPPIQDFANLNIQPESNQAAHEDFPLRQHRGQNVNATNVHGRGYPSATNEQTGNGTDRYSHAVADRRPEPSSMIDHTPRQTTNSTGAYQESYDYHEPEYNQPRVQTSKYSSRDNTQDAGVIYRKQSIPRKDVPSGAQATDAHRQPQPLTPSHAGRTRDHPNHSSGPEHQHSDNYGSRPQSSNYSQYGDHYGSPKYASRSAQDIVDRARGSTYDTEVVEKVAPGKLVLLLPTGRGSHTYTDQPLSMNVSI